MAKFQKRDKAAALRWNSFTKAELIRTVKTLNARQTKLLNRIATLEREREGAAVTAAQDAVNSAMEVRQPLATLCDDFTRYNADDVREPAPVNYHALPADIDEVCQSEAEERRRVFGPFPWEKK